MVDPASPFVPPVKQPVPEEANPLFGHAGDDDTRIDISQLLKTQLRLTNTLQKQLVEGGINSLPPREVKELLTAVGSMLTLAHKTDEVLRELETYKLLLEVIFEWVRRRADSTGEDLLTELRGVASELRNSEGVTADKFF
jgi:hypothetical protein